MSKIKSFRAKIANGTQDTISLHTNNGSTGYRIKKFQVMNSGNDDVEATIKIHSVKQSTITGDIDFSDQTLLGAAYFTSHSTAQLYPEDSVIIFDNVTFNQDIYVTLKCFNVTADMNYYIELEQVKLDLTENTVATLKDIRNITGQ
tara:strand:+ start:1340 stop:1777 length:438 start_codon:yes stop_codon:yes gene_type:complete